MHTNKVLKFIGSDIFVLDVCQELIAEEIAQNFST